MSAKRKFVFVQDTTVFNNIFADLDRDNRGIVLHGPCKDIKCELLKKIRRLHLSRMANSLFELPFKSIWGCSLYNVDWTEDVKYYVIFDNASISPNKVEYLKLLQEKYDVTFVLCLLDSLDSPACFFARKYMKEIPFKYIFTFDAKDAADYNYIFFSTFYSAIRDPNDVTETPIDLYYVGTNKGGRLKTLYDVYEGLEQNNIKSLVRITSVPLKEIKYKSILYNKKIKYDEVCDEIIKSNCILEITSNLYPITYTLRYFEAICYKKKLLTNNKNITGYPLYDPRFMHIFNTADDIDFDWIKEREDVDYGYDNQFSPVHIIDKIFELEDEEENSGIIEQ